MHKLNLKVTRQEVDGVTGHVTFYVRVIERDKHGNQVGEGPDTPLGISAEAMDKPVDQGGFGGHGEAEMRQFLAKRKQQIVDAYYRIRECGEHAPKLEGEEL